MVKSSSAFSPSGTSPAARPMNGKRGKARVEWSTGIEPDPEVLLARTTLTWVSSDSPVVRLWWLGDQRLRLETHPPPLSSRGSHTAEVGSLQRPRMVDSAAPATGGGGKKVRGIFTWASKYLRSAPPPHNRPALILLGPTWPDRTFGKVLNGATGSLWPFSRVEPVLLKVK